MKHYLAVAFLFLALSSYAQYPYDNKRGNVWLSGYNEGTVSQPLFGVTQLKFDQDTFAISKVDTLADFEETIAIACDTDGSLLFSTNGIWVYDKNFKQMAGSDTLNPGLWSEATADEGYPVSQGALILNQPDNSNIYFLFHSRIRDDARCEGVYYTVIDMNIPAVTSLRNPIVNNTVLENGKLSACRHANGRDWWVIFWKSGTNMYRRSLLSPNGLNDLGWDTVGLPLSPDLPLSQSCFSPDGSKYAVFDDYYSYVLDVYDFDRCDGRLSNQIRLNENDTCYSGGCAFSPSGKYLYVACSKEIFQYDLFSPDIQASRQTVATWDGFIDPDFALGSTYFHLLEETPNGKIICNTPNGTRFLHLINEPDSLGVASDVQQHYIHLNTFNARSIPNYPNFRLGPVDGSVCDTLGIDVGIAEPPKQTYNPQADLEVYPNPAGNYCNIGFGSTLKQDGVLIVHDLNDHTIFETPIQKATIGYTLKTESYTPGMYLCTVYEGSKAKGGVRFVKE